LTLLELSTVLGGFGSAVAALIAVCTIPVLLYQVAENRRFQAAQIILSASADIAKMVEMLRDRYLKLSSLGHGAEWAAQADELLLVLREINYKIGTVSAMAKHSPTLLDTFEFSLVMTDVEQFCDALDIDSDALQAAGAQAESAHEEAVDPAERAVRTLYFDHAKELAEKVRTRLTALL